jgi:Protein of unknown function (DUF2971)
MNKQLYHYTSSTALVNILNTGYLRATHASQFSDGSECRHAIDTLRHIAPELDTNELWKSVETTLLSQPRYIVCFSKKRNDCHQWKNYGENGAGACIVIDPELTKNNNPTGMWDLFDCHYDQNEQQSILKNFSKDICARGDYAVAEIIQDFWQRNISFKREGFSRENEARYVFNPNFSGTAVKQSISDAETRAFHERINAEFSKVSHPSGLFDEHYRPLEPFVIKGAISEIILGPRFHSSLHYFDFLKNNYTTSQFGKVF